MSDKEFLTNLMEKAIASSKETGVLEEYNLRFCRVITPMGTILVYADMSSENYTLNNLVRISLLIGAFSFLAFLGISIFLSRRAVRPVEVAWQQQKEFVANASHELKTPLTVILTNAELLGEAGYDEAEKDAFSRSILIMGQQMKALLEKLLELAKSDAGQMKQQMKPVDFGKLVLDMVISFEGVFADKGLMIESDIAPEINVNGCEQSLRQVVDILLDNAQKYSSPVGETRVRLYKSGQSRCRLSVSNPGAEIPPENLKKIFRRFYRMDEARSRDGSFGLGLSIAESIVIQHKGKIWAESRDGYNTFIVEFRCVE